MVQALTRIAPAVCGGIGGFALGGPGGAVAGAAAGAALGEQIGNLCQGVGSTTNRVADDAASNLDAAQKAVVAGVEKTAEAVAETIKMVGKAWAPIYLAGLGMSTLSDYGHSSFEWHAQHCRHTEEWSFEDGMCKATMLGAIISVGVSVAAMCITYKQIAKLLDKGI